ncbi:MBL fold metallo-hydrolase [Prevotella bivia]|jgi:hypothetical protein|uniref:MBL fold metallo-hydrolase n=1 Tax=Prevotella bivia TaxID=28125 RepID=UPI00077719F9|nr:MBL fold metallo-hydrolase [Prevotella bivia]KXU56581.1 metallo-beta-lactamase domain protein [Prevotella bivia]WIL18845.1 MBL fold metallo-hydrolase [Prevotella bivia]
MKNNIKVTFLGTGTSNGVPFIGCKCEVCTSTDPHDKRLRSSALIETENTRLLIDCGPDFRQQILPQPFRKIDGVLLTHIHYDHVGGIDDLRAFCALGDIDVYANKHTCEGLHHNIPYCFTDHLYPGVPKLSLHSVEPHQKLHIGDFEVEPFEVIHGKLPILGYRIGSLAYITDMKSIEDKELLSLKGIKTLIINGLRWDRPHHSHQLIPEAITFSKQIKAEQTYLIHMTDRAGLHAESQKRLPKNVHFAYDGQILHL